MSVVSFISAVRVNRDLVIEGGEGCPWMLYR